jgi:hypothetical protein
LAPNGCQGDPNWHPKVLTSIANSMQKAMLIMPQNVAKLNNHKANMVPQYSKMGAENRCRN